MDFGPSKSLFTGVAESRRRRRQFLDTDYRLQPYRLQITDYRLQITTLQPYNLTTLQPYNFIT